MDLSCVNLNPARPAHPRLNGVLPSGQEYPSISSNFISPRPMPYTGTMTSSITASQFAQGMTFDQYVAFIGSPENLQRAASQGPRQALSTYFREAFERARLTEDQEAALTWLVARPNGP